MLRANGSEVVHFLRNIMKLELHLLELVSN